MSLTKVILFFDIAFNVYKWMLFARVILSWFPLPSGDIFRNIWKFLYEITEPFLSLFRKILPPVAVGGAGMDFSPLIAFFALDFGYNLLIRPLIITVLQMIFI